MKDFPEKLNYKLVERAQEKLFRTLGKQQGLVDFYSNDYLGFSKAKYLTRRANDLINENQLVAVGATGSRLLSGNHLLYPIAEDYLSTLFESEAALIFNSGYDANLGFFQSVPQKGDVVLYDELVHVSIREGIRMSYANSYKFKHNDLVSLENKLTTHREANTIYVVTESVFSMDGDSPDLKAMASLCNSHGGYLVVDEAHATGVAGDRGLGWVAHLELQDQVFARIITFGKALGTHGAAVLGSQKLIDYLINFAKSFIYTTGLPPHTVATTLAALEAIDSTHFTKERNKLQEHINYFKAQIQSAGLAARFIPSESPIQSLLVGDVDSVIRLSEQIKEAGMAVLPIRYPTVAKGSERLRICLHSYNTKNQLDQLINILQ